MSSLQGLVVLILAFISLLFTSAQSSSCNDQGFSFMKKRISITKCKNLGTLEAKFGWDYNEKTHNKTINVCFGARLHAVAGWVAWGVNPCPRPHMVGTRALIGIKQPNGLVVLNTFNITRDTKIGCRLLPSDIEVGVHNQHIEYLEETSFLIISATLTLPPEYNLSKLNHVWQVGSHVEDIEPKMHAVTLQNVDSTETIDLISEETQSIWHQRHHLRTVHGILNIVGWGVLLPIGVIIARYFRNFPVKYSRWYHFHIFCQVWAFTLGSTGWFMGMWLGRHSKFYEFRTHRILGIIIFTFSTLQMLAFLLKPEKKDESRQYWDIYHHFLGYSLIVVIIVNVFDGISILQPSQNWKWSYVGILVLLASIVLVLEVFTWIKFIKKKNKTENKT
ncbi:hypothetical protein HHK36_023880 [Tetracentron sinense]|uniref:Cytochrome b561 and DOMON domain-containing protein n=1 Tax=Tetracentron sinense TaxID=13715 RepID=A0A834YM32_TETSI|nr:hypothetical protein HHK36_023880 [Tetracentron sinense]